jgi:glycosyltransferase involved in cell wall biosynthesis
VHTCAFPYFSLLAAALARPLRRYRLITDWFEVWSDSYWRDYLGGFGGRVGGLVQRLCARVPQNAHCFSELHAQRLRAEGLRGALKVLRGLYGEPTEPPVAREADPVVLFAGRLIPEKQAPLGVAAIALAARRVEGLEGEFLGDGPESGAVAEAIAASGLPQRIHARGFTDAATLDREMRRALCVLLPSRREGYGMVVVEASARGTPSVVVAGEDNAAAELIAEGINGVVAPRADPEAIAEAIETVARAGIAMRRSTAEWYTENRETLSLETSLRAVLAGYSEPAPENSAGRPSARA